MIHPAAVAAVHAQADRHRAMSEARAAWIADLARGYRAETSPAHGAFLAAWQAWSADATPAERQAEASEIVKAMREQDERRKAVPT